MVKPAPQWMMRRRDTIAALSAFVAGVLCLSAPAVACELGLILAHDVSSSVSDEEYDLQTQGHAATFMDPEIQREILAMGEIQVMLIHWSYEQQVRLSWRGLRSRAEIVRFARDLADAPRRFDIGRTAIGDLLSSVDGAWSTPGPDRCRRRIIDISGDGVSNYGGAIAPARVALLAQDVTINGLVTVLPELRNAPPLRHYRSKVIGGPGAFVIEAKGFRDYRRAFREKLLRELRGLRVSERPQRQWPIGSFEREIDTPTHRSEHAKGEPIADDASPR